MHSCVGGGVTKIHSEMNYLSAQATSTHSLIFATLLLMVSTPLFGQESEAVDETESVELPDAVEAAFRAAYPKAEIVGSNIEKEDGKTYYEIESRDGATNRDLLFLGNGTLVETEETIKIGALPEVVRKEAEHRGRVLKAERITRGDTITFELLVRGGKDEHELTLDVEGHIVGT